MDEMINEMKAVNVDSIMEEVRAEVKREKKNEDLHWEHMSKEILVQQVAQFDRQLKALKEEHAAVQEEKNTLENELVEEKVKSELLARRVTALQNEKAALERSVTDMMAEMEQETTMMKNINQQFQEDPATSTPSAASRGTSSPAEGHTQSSQNSILEEIARSVLSSPVSKAFASPVVQNTPTMSSANNNNEQRRGRSASIMPLGSEFSGVESGGSLEEVSRELKAVKDAYQSILIIVSKQEKELDYLKRELFYSLSVAIKLGRSSQGKHDNYTISELYEKMLREKIHYSKWSEWLPIQLNRANPISAASATSNMPSPSRPSTQALPVLAPVIPVRKN